MLMSDGSFGDWRRRSKGGDGGGRIHHRGEKMETHVD